MMSRTRLAAVALAGGIFALGLPATVLGAGSALAEAGGKADRPKQPTRPAQAAPPRQRQSAPPQRSADQSRQRQADQARAAEQARQREAQQRAAEDSRRRAEDQARSRAAEDSRARQIEQQRAAEDARRRAEQSAPTRTPTSRSADEAPGRAAEDAARQRAIEQQRAADLAKLREQQQQRAIDDARRRTSDPAASPRTAPTSRSQPSTQPPPPTRGETGDRSTRSGDPITRDRTPVRTPASTKEPTLAERIRDMERKQAEDRLRTPPATGGPATGAPPGKPGAVNRDPVSGVTPPRGAPVVPRTGGSDPAGGGRIIITPNRGSTDRDPTRGGPGADVPGRGDNGAGEPVKRDPLTGGPSTRDPISRDPSTGGSGGRTPITGAPVARDPISRDRDPITSGPIRRDLPGSRDPLVSRNPVDLPRNPAAGPSGGGRSPIVDDRNPVRGGPAVDLPGRGGSRDPVLPSRGPGRDDWRDGRDWRGDDGWRKNPVYAPTRRENWWRNDCLDDDSWRWDRRHDHHGHAWYGSRDWCDPWRDYDWFCRSSSAWSFSFSWGSHGSSWSLGYSSGSWCPPSYGVNVAWRIHRPYHHVSTWHAPVWYDHYCDWYYGPWYRPYTHVTKVVYETNYYGSSYPSSSYGSSGASSYASGTWDGSPAVYEVPPAVAAQATLDAAWDLLADGYLTEARESFVEVGSLFPFEGGPQVGYAIAAGLLGDRDASVYAMRKALRDEPNALSRVPDTLAIQVHVRALLDRHALDLRDGKADRDTLLMIAALRYLAHEDEAAYFAVNEAIDQGDQDPGTLALKDLLRGALFDRLYR